MTWAVTGSLAIGSLLGFLVATLALHLRWRFHETIGLDDFLALSLIALAYGTALLAHTYGFLAVFAARRPRAPRRHPPFPGTSSLRDRPHGARATKRNIKT